VAVEGIPVRGKQAPFAGRLWNVSLGRSTSSAGVSSLVGARTGDNGCPEDAEEGNDVGMRPFKAYAPDARADDKNATCAPADASFTRSSEPVRVDRHYAPAGQLVWWWRGHGDIEVGQTCASRRNRQRGRRNRTKHGSPRAAAPAREKAPARKKRKEVTASVPARNESSGSCPHVEAVVAEVGRRHLVSNKLGKRAPKRAVRVE
jgi:hypothetical protein